MTMEIRKILVGVVVTLALSGCSAHSPLIMKNTVDTSNLSNKNFPSQTHFWKTGKVQGLYGVCQMKQIWFDYQLHTL